MSSKILKIKNIFLFFLPIIFIFSINTVKADTSCSNGYNNPNGGSITCNTVNLLDNNTNYAPNDTVNVLISVSNGGTTNTTWHNEDIVTINYDSSKIQFSNSSSVNLVCTYNCNYEGIVDPNSTTVFPMSFQIPNSIIYGETLILVKLNTDLIHSNCYDYSGNLISCESYSIILSPTFNLINPSTPPQIFVK